MAGRATLACLLFALLDSFARVAALREALGLESLEEELRSEEESNAERMLAPGTHVCCINIHGHGKEMKADFSVFHESANKEIAKCRMTMITGVNCGNHAACVKECKELAENDRYFRAIMDRPKMEELRRAKLAAQRLENDAKNKHHHRLAGLDQLYEARMLKAKQELEQAQGALQHAKDDYEASERKIEEMEAKIKDLPGHIEELEQSYQQEQDRYNETEANVTHHLKEEQLDSEKAYAAAQEMSKKHMEEAEELGKNYTAELAATHEQLPPEQCKDPSDKKNKYGSIDCCCVIHGTPMKVHTAFKHWDLCKNPRAYKDAGFHMFSCKDFQSCDPCRTLSCGKKMCPAA